MNIRKVLEEQERKILSPHATLSSKTKGRKREQPLSETRLAFQHDRDRIIHSKAFRRLKDKTQVFLSPAGDHYRTRLTHTLEVAQVARAIARSLRLNEDLTEAIALAHDLGHTPFGHAGEEVLNKIYPDGFRHPEQSLRVVDYLEKNGIGLNLTFEVRDGILKHSKGNGKTFSKEKPSTLEGQVVRISDRIAYIAHDIDDALRAGVLTFDQLPKAEINLLGSKHSRRINKMVTDVIQNSMKESPVISMSSGVLEAMENMRTFLWKNLYYDEKTHAEFRKATKLIEDIYFYYMEVPGEIPVEFCKNDNDSKKERLICDFIAGMTDSYALKTYEKIFFPKPWVVM